MSIKREYYSAEELDLITTAESPADAYQKVKAIKPSRSYNAVKQKYYTLRRKDDVNVDAGMKITIGTGPKQIVVENGVITTRGVTIQFRD